MEEFLVTDFLINGSSTGDDLQLFDANEFNLQNDYPGVEASQSSTTASSPYDEDLVMEDAPVPIWSSVPSASSIQRPPSPTRVLAVQALPNLIVKVEQSSPQASHTSSDDEGKATKKRRRDSDEDISDAIPEGLAAVFLKREQLLTISSTEHEAFVQRISNFRDLTEAEQKEVKRQRRLIKNREYAQTSRQKKKVTMGHVKDQVSTLESENDELKEELAKMRSRIMELELENASLCVQLAKDQTSSEDSLDAVVDMETPTTSRSKSFFSKPTFRPAMAATSVLFVFLFAFGFLFNSPLFNAAFSTAALPGAKTVAPYHTGRTIFTVEPAAAFDPVSSDPMSVVPSSLIPDQFTNTSNEILDACFNAVNKTC